MRIFSITEAYSCADANFAFKTIPQFCAYSRLDETTYTIDEVKDLLNGLQLQVTGELDAELINAAHTNVLLLRQMFIQAEKWHLKLSADISELENRSAS